MRAKLELGGRCLLEVQWDRLDKEESVTADQVDIVSPGGFIFTLSAIEGHLPVNTGLSSDVTLSYFIYLVVCCFSFSFFFLRFVLL